MKKLVSDENFNGRVLDGLVLRDPEIDLARVTEIGLSGISDADLLPWAAAHDRILLSHDRKTMVPLAKQRIIAGEPMAGLIIVTAECPIGKAIEQIRLVLECHPEEGWKDYVVELPF